MPSITDKETDDGSGRWIAHDGGEMPVGASAVVVVEYRCGTTSEPTEAGKRRWRQWTTGASEWDIVRWRPAAKSDS